MSQHDDAGALGTAYFVVLIVVTVVSLLISRGRPERASGRGRVAWPGRRSGARLIGYRLSSVALARCKHRMYGVNTDGRSAGATGEGIMP